MSDTSSLTDQSSRSLPTVVQPRDASLALMALQAMSPPKARPSKMSPSDESVKTGSPTCHGRGGSAMASAGGGSINTSLNLAIRFGGLIATDPSPGSRKSAKSGTIRLGGANGRANSESLLACPKQIVTISFSLLVLSSL